MRPLIISCGSGVNLRFLLKWLKDGGYGSDSPDFRRYGDDFPEYYHVMVMRDGKLINTAPSLDVARMCLGGGSLPPIVYSDIGIFLTSHRNVAIDGASRVHPFLPPTV